MENASEAIKMAGAIMIFTMALAVVMNMFTSARAAADGVMNRNDYTKTYYAAQDTAESLNFDLAYQKVVGIDEVLATMYNYYTEGTTILFYTAEGDQGENSNLNENVYLNNDEIQPIVLYYTEANRTQLTKSSLNIQSYTYNRGDTNNNPSAAQRAIFGLSSSDEIIRNEPWTAGNTEYRKFLNDLVAGRRKENSTQYNRGGGINATTYSTANRITSVGNSSFLQYGFGFFGQLPTSIEDGPLDGSNTDFTINSLTGNINGFLGFRNDARFVERIGQFDYKSRNVGTDGIIDEGTVMLNNGEVLEADASTTKKRVIQFIYLR